MPSAANTKIEKQAHSESSLADSSGNALTPMRQAITVIEHKIRNLEKRKAKLESYRELQNSGKELNQDQKTAVAKYDEVIQTLDFARDLCKQFLGIANVSEKEAKKQARKEAAARSQAELAKIREVLLVQDALNQMGQDNVREDFLNGTNGATQLTAADLKLLDDIYPAVTPKHEPGDPTAFANQVQAAAEHLLAVVDGKSKEAFGATYSQIKEVIGKIHESGYLDQAVVTSYDESVEVIENDQIVTPEIAVPTADIPPQETVTAIESLTIEANVAVMPQPPNPQPPIAQAPPEQLYYQQPPRPITEMLGSGNFYFLQDSELDTPDTLPTQTFTNTSFVQPPPPIPLPPNFQPYPPQQNNPVNLPPPPGNGIDEAPKATLPPQQPPLQQQQQPQQPQQQAPQPDIPQKARSMPQKSNNQAYYQNNRPRQNRNGPRAGNRFQQ